MDFSFYAEKLKKLHDQRIHLRVAERVDRFSQALVYHIEVHDAAYTNFLTRKLQGGKK